MQKRLREQYSVVPPLRILRKITAFDKRNVLSESYRLATFASWPTDIAVTKQSLEAAGFYYLQHDDNFKCAYCSLELIDWKKGDDPMKNHERWSPRCPFVRAARDFDGNVEIVRKISNDECGWYRTEFRPHARAQKGKQSIDFILQHMSTLLLFFFLATMLIFIVFVSRSGSHRRCEGA